MSAPTDPNYDPLVSAIKRPAVSFKHAQKGERKRLRVESLSREAQQTDYDTGKPAFWPSDTPGQQGNPKMAVVFDVFDETAGEPRALWCPKPSSMLNAVAAAQSKAGERIKPGGYLEVWINDFKDTGDRKKEAQKLYAAEYFPPEPADPLSSGQAQADTSPWAGSAPAGGGDDSPPF